MDLIRYPQYKNFFFFEVKSRLHIIVGDRKDLPPQGGHPVRIPRQR